MATRTTVEITMPQMGESVTEGTILEWRKQVGDPVDQDEALVDVSTDKVDTEVPAPVAGTLIKVLVQADETVPVGTVLGEIEVNGEGPQSTVRSPQGDGSDEPVDGGPSTVDSTSSEELVDVEFPQMGDSVTEGTVLEWLKQPGDPVALEEGIVEISTDKVDAEVPSPAAGTLAEILVQADETVPTGTVLCRIAAGAGAAAAAPEPPPADTAALEGRPAPAPTAGNGADNATPVAARMASAHGLDVAAIHGSGPRGRVTKDDVLAHAEGNGGAPAAAPAPPPSPLVAEDKPLRGPAATLASPPQPDGRSATSAVTSLKRL